MKLIRFGTSCELTSTNHVSVIQHKIKVMIAAIYETRLTSIVDVTLDSTKMCNVLVVVVVVVREMVSCNTKYCYLKK
jgi:hypothetical protein